MTITKTSGFFLMPKGQELRTAIESAAEKSDLSEEARKALAAFMASFDWTDLLVSRVVHSDKWEEIAEECGIDEEFTDEAADFVDMLPNLLKPFADVDSIPVRDPKEIESKREALAEKFRVPLESVSYFGREERKGEHAVFGLKPDMCDFTGDFFSVKEGPDSGVYVDAESLTHLRDWGCL